MTIKCLTDKQKNFVIYHYHKKSMNQKQLAQELNVSERTINRVLIAYGLATPVARIKGEAHQVMQLLAKNQLDIKSLKALLKHSLGGCYVE